MVAACENTCLTEERLTKLIKSIFNEKFERQQQNIVNVKMREIGESKTKLSDLKQSIELTVDKLQEKLNDLKSATKKLKT